MDITYYHSIYFFKLISSMLYRRYQYVRSNLFLTNIEIHVDSLFILMILAIYTKSKKEDEKKNWNISKLL